MVRLSVIVLALGSAVCCGEQYWCAVATGRFAEEAGGMRWASETPGAHGIASVDVGPRRGAMVSVLYAPAEADNPTFRSQLAALLDGSVDYFNACTGTPTLSQLLQHNCVFTWANYSYADRQAFGDVLADYVDAGGRVILGQWAYDALHSPAEVYGRIMEWTYCPVDAQAWGSGTYAGDGDDCVHADVLAYASSYVDCVTLRPGAQSDGTFDTGRPAVAWRADRRVYYNPGNTGGMYSTGDWVRLTANMCTCQAPPITGDLNCDGAVNAFDIDPFVLALTSPPSYAAQFPHCDQMLADCNGDGFVNTFDIDPFVQLLTAR